MAKQALAVSVGMLSVFELKGEHWCVQKGALTTAEVCEALGLGQLKNRSWHVQGAISIRGEGLYEGLDWYVVSLHSLFLRLQLEYWLHQPEHLFVVCRLANTLKNMQRSGQVTNVAAAGR